MSLGIVKLAKKQEEVNKEVIRSWFSRLSKEKQRRLVINDDLVTLINDSINDPVFDGFKFIDTLITYQSVLEDTKLSAYVDAIRYCSFLEVNGGNAIDAYIKAFCHRDFVKERMGYDASSVQYSQIQSASTRYRKSSVVMKILTQSEVPLYLMFQGYRYKAVARLAKEMEEAKHPRDRINAADKLLTHLKPPEGLKIEVDINENKSNIIDVYESAMKRMVEKQKELILSGADIKEVSNAKIIEAEVIE